MIVTIEEFYTAFIPVLGELCLKTHYLWNRRITFTLEFNYLMRPKIIRPNLNSHGEGEFGDGELGR